MVWEAGARLLALLQPCVCHPGELLSVTLNPPFDVLEPRPARGYDV